MPERLHDSLATVRRAQSVSCSTAEQIHSVRVPISPACHSVRSTGPQKHLGLKQSGGAARNPVHVALFAHIDSLKHFQDANAVYDMSVLLTQCRIVARTLIRLQQRGAVPLAAPAAGEHGR